MARQKITSSIKALLLIVALLIIGFTAWYVVNARKTTDDSYAAASKAMNTAADTSHSQQKDEVTDFASCYYVVGKSSQTKPYICEYQGKTYAAPTVFDDSSIMHLDKTPDGVRPILTAYVKTEFNICEQENAGPFSATVSLAQANFVDIGLGCDSGHHQRFGLKDGVWTNLGGGQFSVDCETVDTYSIKRSSTVDVHDSGAYDTCYYASSNGARSKPIPE